MDTDVTTDAGFKQIKWASAPSFDVTDARWICHAIMHDGDGPLGRPMLISAPVGRTRIHASYAAEIAAGAMYCDDLEPGDRETIKIAVHLQGMEFCAYGVVVRLEPSFDAREM